MPLFEYRCSDCGARFSQLVGMTADSREPACPKCGSANANKLISRFQRARSDDDRLDSFEDAALAGGDDPAAMSRLMREMGKELGEDGEEDIDEYLEEAEKEMYDGENEDEL
jgi:putative FmdB family regulatory protein